MEEEEGGDGFRLLESESAWFLRDKAAWLRVPAEERMEEGLARKEENKRDERRMG